MSQIPVGTVRINSTKVVTGSIGEQFVLLHVPKDRIVELNEFGHRLWKKIENGNLDIATLIREHVNESKVSEEVAAFQIITFLDELRALDYVDFTLSREREIAPLLDVRDVWLEDIRCDERIDDAEIADERCSRPRGKSRSACKTMCR